jgi:hypothetical protein
MPKTVDLFDGLYSISEEGQLWNCRRKMYHTWSPDRYGYPRVSMKARLYPVHRLVATSFMPNPNNLPVVNHIDGDVGNPHVDNLEWVSIGDNVRHAYRTGLRTTDHVQKLTEDDVALVLSSNTPARLLATQLGVTPSRIWQIRRWQGSKRA